MRIIKIKPEISNLPKFLNKYRRSLHKRGHIKLIALGNSILANNRYAGGPGRAAPELIFRNNDRDFPGYVHRDLISVDSNAELFQLAEDGGTFRSVLEAQVRNLPARRPDDVVIVLLAVGGNDLLKQVQEQPEFSEVTFARFINRLRHIVDYLRAVLSPEITLIANTYDPTGGAGEAATTTYADIIPVVAARRALERINRDVSEFCTDHHLLLIDLYRAFQGHGFDQAAAWITQHIEPNYQGSHIIRSIIWSALSKELVKYGFSPV